jgi:hypothetical protein
LATTTDKKNAPGAIGKGGSDMIDAKDVMVWTNDKTKQVILLLRSLLGVERTWRRLAKIFAYPSKDRRADVMQARHVHTLLAISPQWCCGVVCGHVGAG